MVDMLKAIQIMEDAKDETEAISMLEAMRIQLGFLGGRVLPPAGVVGKGSWRVQVFVADVPNPMNDWLPDGMRHVVIPDCIRAELGIAA